MYIYCIYIVYINIVSQMIIAFVFWSLQIYGIILYGGFPVKHSFMAHLIFD